MFMNIELFIPLWKETEGKVKDLNRKILQILSLSIHLQSQK